MIINWIRFVVLAIVAYTSIATMGYLGAVPGAENIWQVLRNAFQPHVVALMLLGNGIWIVAVYYGRLESAAATSIIVAIGVVTIFTYYALVWRACRLRRRDLRVSWLF